MELMEKEETTIKIYNRVLPQVNKLLEITGAANLVLTKDLDKTSLAHDNNLTFIHDDLDELEADHGASGIKIYSMFVDGRDFVASVHMITPTKYRIVTGYTFKSAIAPGSSWILELFKDLCHCGIIEDILKLGGYVIEDTSGEYGYPSTVVFKDVIERLGKRGSGVKGLISTAPRKLKSTIADVSALPESRHEVAKFLTSKRGVGSDQLSPILEKIALQEKTIKLMENQIKRLHELNSNYIVKHTRLLFGGNTVLDKLASAPESIFDASGNYNISIRDDRLVLTVRDVILSCAKTSLSSSERLKYGNLSNVINIYWVIGTINVIIEVSRGGSVGINYEGEDISGGRHPHISSGSLCSDPRIKTTVATCLANGDIMSLCKYMRQFLSVYNPGSPHAESRPHQRGLQFFHSLKEATNHAKGMRTVS